MEVEFRRTGARRYAVIARRDGRALREIDPAPGFDSSMPHDLLHFVVEAELKLALGIFGQIATNRHAAVIGARTSERAARRERRRAAQDGERLRRIGHADAASSEAAVYFYGVAWRRQRRDEATPARVLADPVFDRVCARLDELSHAWKKLGVGESLTVDWPESTVKALPVKAGLRARPRRSRFPTRSHVV